MRACPSTRHSPLHTNTHTKERKETTSPALTNITAPLSSASELSETSSLGSVDVMVR
jgi:hypothetical protein